MPISLYEEEEDTRYSFLDDYCNGAHPSILEALVKSNSSRQKGYGSDNYCKLATQRIREHMGRGDVDVFYVPNGTSANVISIAASLRAHEAVIAASSGHIVAREAGAIEAAGHKIIISGSHHGKITPEDVEQVLDSNWHFPHMAKPRMLYISNATELGTTYSRAELVALKDVCERNRLLLLMDGARLGAALAATGGKTESNDLTMGDLADLTDIFWIGGTKNGALLGEAVVVSNPAIAEDFRFYIKQRGCLLSKSRVIGAQFAEFFREGLYLDAARRANEAAAALSGGIEAAGFPLWAGTETNQVFAVLPMGLVEVLQRQFEFYVWEKLAGGEAAVVRLITTWETDPAEVAEFVRVIVSWAKTA